MYCPTQSKPLLNEAEIEAFERERTLEERIPRTVYDLFRLAAEEFTYTPAISLVLHGTSEEIPRRVSYAELHKRVTQTANLFASLIGTGGGVAYLLPSLLETQFVLWGAETAGYAVPLNPLLQEEHLLSLMRASGARVLVTCGPDISREIWQKSEFLWNSLPDIHVVCIGPSAHVSPPLPRWTNYSSAIELQNGSALAFEDDDPDRIVAYFHTGGTTGTPKLVGHTNRNQLAAALGIVSMLGLCRSDVVTNGMPLFHVAGAIASSLAVYMSGGHVLTLSPGGLRNPAMIKNFWPIVEMYGVTVIGAVPTALGAILSIPSQSDLSKVRLGITGSASTPRRTAERFREVTGRHLHEVLGMTESGGVTAAEPPSGTETIGSVGYRIPYTRLSIRKESADGTVGAECAPGEVGVLFVSGPTVSPGYRTATDGPSVFVNGELNSGDLAYRDVGGKLFIVGRAKDLIIRGGHNIDPAMIEAAFLSHPEVSAAAAVGQLDSYAGELPVCYVVLSPEAKVKEEELADFAKSRIAERPAWPKSVYMLPALPMTAVGKVYKPALRADAAQKILAHTLREVAAEYFGSVVVSEGRSRGLRATVRLQGPTSETRERVLAVLKSFVIEFDLIDDAESRTPSQ